MTDKDSPLFLTKAPKMFDQLVTSAFLGVWMLGAFTLAVQRFGSGFLVGPQWHSLIFVPAQIFGLLVAALSFRYLRTGIRRADQKPAEPGVRKITPIA
jgi:hypothetical protein